MTVNISSRKVELLIGGQDWTNWIDPDSGIQVGNPEYEVGSGLLLTTGTINLKFGANYSLLPSNPYYRFNPNQWKRGQTVTIKVASTSGTLTYLPCSGGGLRITKAPQPPTKEIGGVQKMSIQIGCKLALEYFPPEPNKDVSGVVAGTNLDIAVIINNILNFIGLNSAFSNIGYFINYPLPKTGGNWLQMAGQLAASAGRYLRCDVNGNVTGYLIDMYIGTATANYVIGRDEQDWEAIGDISEQPVEKLILTGVKQIVEPVVFDDDPSEVIEIQPAGVLFPDNPLGQSAPTALYTAKKTITTKENIIGESKYKETVQIIQPAGVLFPDNSLGQSAPTALYTAKKTINTYLFTKGIVSSLAIQEIQPAGVLFPDNPLGQSAPTALYTSKLETQSWVSTGDQKWTKNIEILEPAGVLFPDISLGQSAPTALYTSSTFTDDKDTSGPPTNIGGGEVSENTLKEEQIKAEVFALQLAADGRERQRTIAVPFVTNISQLTSYGSLYNKFLTGRAFGWRFGGAITDAALTFQPFQTVTVTVESNLYYLKLDALQYAISQTEAICFWHGIEVGVANVATPDDISKPLEITLGSFDFIGSIAANCSYYTIEVETMAATISSNCILPFNFNFIGRISANCLEPVGFDFNFIGQIDGNCLTGSTLFVDRLAGRIIANCLEPTI